MIFASDDLPFALKMREKEESRGGWTSLFTTTADDRVAIWATWEMVVDIFQGL